MKLSRIFLFTVLLTNFAYAAEKSESPTKKGAAKMTNTTIQISTSLGDIEAELFDKEAPVSVANFLNYVDKSFFNETVFHRVIPNFMIQGGGFTSDMKQKQTEAAIKIESDNGKKNEKGTLAMARTMDPNSATSQFFINTKDNDFLNYSSPTPNGYGYAVFGKVTKGMDVVEKIEKVKTTSKGFHENVPAEAVVIKSITRKH